MIFEIENWPWKSDLSTFWKSIWRSVKVKLKKMILELIFEHSFPLFSWKLHNRGHANMLALQ